MTTPLVLIVSRDVDALNIFGAVLRHAGFGVREVRDPAAVLSMAAAEPPSLVVTSYPTYAGEATVTELLRGDSRTVGVPILSVTSHVFPDDLRRADEAGVSASLPMPVSIASFLAEVRRLLNAASPGG